MKTAETFKNCLIENTRGKAMNVHYALIAAIVTCLLASRPVFAQAPSAFGSGFDVQDFYKPFTPDEITPQNMQTWPFYKYVSAHWEDYGLHGTAKISRSAKPAKLTVAAQRARFDRNAEFTDGQTFIESVQASQTKGFVVMRRNYSLA